ncbi:MAG: LysM peptidoglycan-binding domain-containing protein [Alphaproteobacteria bacterium]
MKRSWWARLLTIGIIIGGVYYSQLITNEPADGEAQKVEMSPRPTTPTEQPNDEALKKALNDAQKVLSRTNETKPDVTATSQSSNSSKMDEGEKAANDNLPRFDVAEVDELGNGVFSGRAFRNVRVWLKKLDGSVVGETVSLEDGSFTILTNTPLPEGESVLALVAEEIPGGEIKVASERLVISRFPGGPALIVAQKDTADTVSRILQEPVTRKPLDTAQKSGDNASVSNSNASKESAEGKLLKIKIIDYDEKGRLAISGKAKPGSKISIEVNGRTIGSTNTDDQGQWSLTTIEGMADGANKIVAKASLGDEYSTTSMPFAPDELVQKFPKGRLVVVQPGNSLWRIARRTYGSGFRYTVIFAANRDQVTNPDLIYPGQVLHTPPVK